MIAIMAPQLALAGGLVGVLSLGLVWPGKRALSRASSAVVVALALYLLTTVVGGSELLMWDGTATLWHGLIFLSALAYIALADFDSGFGPELTLGSVLGMSLMASANHLFVLFIGLEIMSLSIYLLIYSQARTRAALEGAVKYFFAGSVAAGLFLFGFSIHLFFTRDALVSSTLSAVGTFGSIGLILMICAALFKCGAIPLHFWLPDAYESAPPELAGYMSTAVKAAGILMLLRLLNLDPSFAAIQGSGIWSWFPWIAGVTMIAGALAALGQDNLQRLLAYSSISHAGFMLAGLWAWSKAPSAAQPAPASVYLYLLGYLFMSTGAFACVKMSGARSVAELRGLGGRSPKLAAFFTLFLLGLGGIPPTAGFLTKVYIFWDVLRVGGVALAAAAGVASLVGLGFYFRMIRAMTIEPAGPATAAAPAGSWSVLTACAAGTIGLGLMPGSILWIMEYLR